MPYCELVCANILDFDRLINSKLQTRKFKGADVATFNITGNESIIATCKAVRIVNLLKRKLYEKKTFLLS